VNKREIGEKAEQKALAFLSAQAGFQKFIAQNYKRLPYGEIDLIVIFGNTLIFVEVKSRKNDSFGTASEMVSIHKQQKIIATAQVFLQENENKYLDYDFRFDVVAITDNHLEWLKNAFMLE